MAKPMPDATAKAVVRGATPRMVQWSAAAQGDLASILDYIASRDPLQAEQILEQLQSQAQGLGLFAERGRRIPELRGSRHSAKSLWRELLVRPWRIVYALEGSTVLVLAVVDGRRDFVAWLAGRAGAETVPSLD
jgi:toxin ParE1/3/4